jgi:5-methylcytosine-specific restriction endonuclease McrA
MTLKTCSQCGRSLPLEQFHKNPATADGRRSNCRDCQNRAAKNYRSKHVAELYRWRKERSDRILDNVHRWNEEHPGWNSAQQRGCRQIDLTRDEWEDIKKQYKSRCAYCGKKRKLTIDHIVPIRHGGAHTASNVVPCCKSCNSRKNVASPDTNFQPALTAVDPLAQVND